MPNRKMKLAVSFLALLLALQAAAASAQTLVDSKPKFSLVITLPVAEGKPNLQKLRVMEFNRSKESYREDGCLEKRGFFTISILYNGKPLQERDAEARKKREEAAKATPCDIPTQTMRPNNGWPRYFDLTQDFPVEVPGSYEVTVSRESDLEHPEKSMTVKSNTLRFWVQEPIADKPQ
jgi:hypothetical protein